MDVEALLFDVGGTVFDWRTAVIDALGAVASAKLRARDSGEFAEEWRKRSLMAVDAVAWRETPWRAFDQILEDALDQTLAMFDIEDLSPEDRAHLLAAWERMPAWDEAPGGLARLRSRYFLAPLTILSLRTAAHSSRRAGIVWDAIVSCDAIGAMKPDPASYVGGLAAIGRPGDKVMFVAAHPGDLRAAAQHGMRTAFLKPRLEDWGDDYTDTGFANEFDIVAEDFADLAGILGT